MSATQCGAKIHKWKANYTGYPAPMRDAIADVVLNYRPKSKQPKPRKRKKTKRVKRG